MSKWVLDVTLFKRAVENKMKTHKLTIKFGRIFD